MTEPRPRLTRTIGSVQQTNVVSDDARPTNVRRRGRMDPSSSAGEHTTTSKRKSDQQMYGMKVRRIVRPFECRDVNFAIAHQLTGGDCNRLDECGVRSTKASPRGR
jgi:hypothetical protein